MKRFDFLPNYHYESIEGLSSVTANKCVGEPLRNYKVEGNSVQYNKNMITYPYKDTTKTVNGITFTDNGDGSVTVNGTATDKATFNFKTLTSSVKLKKNTTYTLSGCPENGSNDTYFLRLFISSNKYYQDNGTNVTFTNSKEYSDYSVYMTIRANTKVENLTVYPQLEEGTEATEYSFSYPSPNNPIEIVSVGEKTRNIWYPSVDALKSNGITCTRNNDNTYTVNGTATADFYFNIGKITIEVGTTYYLSGGTSQVPIAFQLREGSTGVDTLYNHGGITTFSPTGKPSIDIINCVIVVRSGVEVNNVIVKPMISLENTDEYEPYGYKIPVIARGKNLLDISTAENKTVNGVEISVDYVTQKIKAKGVGTSNGGKLFYLAQITLPAGTYYFSSNTELPRAVLTNVNSTSSVVAWCNRAFTLTETTALGLGFNVIAGTEYDAEILLQITEGENATDYEPYVEPIITNIYLDEPLRSYPNYYYNKFIHDYIDTQEKKVYIRGRELILTGTENWSLWLSKVKSYYIYVKDYISTTQPIIFGICTHYSKNTSSDIDVKDGIYTSNSASIIITDLNCDDVDSFKTFLQEQYANGTPVKVTVRCNEVDYKEEPIELPKLPTFKGTTIYEIGTEVLPNSTMIQAYKY